MPWIKEERLYPVIVLLLIFIIAVRAPLDSDMWWHLRAGEETLQSGQVYRIDTFSSTRVGENWINHSWLSQVLMAVLMRMGGFTALSVWVAVCAVISMGLVYLSMKGHPLLRSAVLILAAMVSSVVWSPRPQIMSLVLLALVSWLAGRYRANRKWIYLALIPPLFGLWGNLHGGYILGLIYLGAFAAGEILDKILFRARESTMEWKEIGLLGAVMAGGLVLVLVNPFGIQMWKIPFNTVGVETLQNLINEWASPDFHQAFQQPLLWMLLGLLGLLGISGKTARGSQLVPAAAFAYAALVARRNFGPSAIVSAPIIAEQLSYVLDKWLDNLRQEIPFFEQFMVSAEENKEKFNQTARNLINLTLVLLLLFAAVLKTIQVNDPDLLSQLEKEYFPAEAAQWIEEEGRSFKIFNDYNWGGYLIYRLPDYLVFVDGRTDLFGDEILEDYNHIMRTEGNWEEILESYQLDTLLLPENSHLAKTASLLGWAELYRDDKAVLLGKD